MASTPVPANTLPGSKTIVELGQVVKATFEQGSPLIFRRDGRFVDMVMAEFAGRFEAPLYGMLEVDNRINTHDRGTLPKPAISLHGQPADELHPTLLWDGEWKITWVTFRDMGVAFGAAILGIYVLVVAQFRSFRLPLVILTPSVMGTKMPPRQRVNCSLPSSILNDSIWGTGPGFEQN